MYDTLVSDFGLSIGQFFGPNKKKVEKMIENIQKLMPIIDSVLDKPVDENNPHFCCGDLLENVIDSLSSLVGELDHYEKIFKAKAAAWDKFPEEEYESEDEGNEQDSYRRGFIYGFMDALKNE